MQYNVYDIMFINPSPISIHPIIVLALDAISAGLGAMFPTPALAILIMHELTLAAGF
jgi:hypothetical protein